MCWKILYSYMNAILDIIIEFIDFQFIEFNVGIVYAGIDFIIALKHRFVVFAIERVSAVILQELQECVQLPLDFYLTEIGGRLQLMPETGYVPLEITFSFTAFMA